jgi:hypothetical protein
VDPHDRLLNTDLSSDKLFDSDDDTEVEEPGRKKRKDLVRSGSRDMM